MVKLIDMICNPCKWYSGGGSSDNVVEFTYGPDDKPECGKYLWHFSPNLNNLSTSMENNIVWFADDVHSAMKILREMFEFRLECARKQSDYYRRKSANPHAEEFYDNQKYVIDMFEGYLKAIDKKKLIITLAPTNQFFKVGWASNDTVR